MSDSDDGFDEEAVREELREKYEDERQDREATARMSDLLLQGATMTNDHCDRCGSPLFRQDGQTFCPNCQHAARQAQTESTQQNQSQQAPNQQAQRQGGQDPQTRPEAAEPTARPDEAGADDQHRPPAAGRRTPPSQQDGDQTPDGQRGRDTTETPARTDPSNRDLPEHAPTATASGPAGDALESTIAALARRAASADDPRTAREYLEAAREAAEALAALRQ
ncbi:Sjogren's syndrome/scleroderma autoantigen 1 family protein [Halobacterium jilantaiense]|uniref:Sjogren's syndrome/scleroderma autoantigen 1 (Autoantigen p27) n=1 Tax=Halobacterium jilantaiense TaxID=355548 RepID=A0A1I0PQW4_9EURY|nr:Sjogren's syndrome/scleroderma autoantigen 1 family protein [Halobacterium jilantaiense]SEW16751.1 Sjogren's syndrome/scleroderma autoantigen 1 (Autoantigen p27) [Halobacterium jilantaiense]